MSITPKFLLSLSYQLLKVYCGKPVPIFCEWEITYRCNMKCSFCNQPQFANNWTPELTIKGAKTIIDELYQMGTRMINMSGGEPLVKPELIEIAKYIKRKGIFLSLNTNALLIDKKVAEKIRIFDVVRISLDGPPHKHDQERNSPGAFERTINAIKLLQEKGVKVMINSVITKKHTFQEICQLTEIIKGLGLQITFSKADTICSSLLKPNEEYYRKINTNFIPRDEDVIRTIKKLKKKYRHTVANTNLYSKVLKAHGLDVYGCTVLDTSISIKPDGSVSLPCNDFPMDPKKNGSLKSIFYSAKADYYRQNLGKFWFCKGCKSRCSIFPTAFSKPFGIVSIAAAWARTIIR